MKSLLIALPALAAVACSPIPELAGVFQVTDADTAADMSGGHIPSFDMGGMTGTAPCPKVFGTATPICYWAQGTGDTNIATALALVGSDPNCSLMAGRLSVNASGLTCAIEFASNIVAGWGFSTMKPVNMAFSYSIKSTTDRATLTVYMPSGSMNSVIQVNGIAGSANVINLFSPTGTMFAPGFSVGLAGAARKATVSVDWISIWQ